MYIYIEMSGNHKCSDGNFLHSENQLCRVKKIKKNFEAEEKNNSNNVNNKKEHYVVMTLH